MNTPRLPGNFTSTGSSSNSGFVVATQFCHSRRSGFGAGSFSSTGSQGILGKQKIAELDWQKGHLGYWKNTNRWRKRTLQDACSEQVPLKLEVTPGSPTRTLQDLCSMQTPLFVGLIAMLAGSTLQDDIATTTRQLVAKGYRPAEKAPGLFHGAISRKNPDPFPNRPFCGMNSPPVTSPKVTTNKIVRFHMTRNVGDSSNRTFDIDIRSRIHERNESFTAGQKSRSTAP